MNVSLQYICDTTGGTLLQGSPDKQVYGVSTDSRAVSGQPIFFALTGESFDGHDYLGAAFHNGAGAACISRDLSIEPAWQDKGIIKVDDTLRALQDLAKSYRRALSIPVVGVTGSVGKTTTKELIALCLSGKFPTYKSGGNYNNDIGLPLSLLAISSDQQAAVVEMAMRALGEIRRLAAICRPSCAVITNAEAVHLETLGTVDNVARAKCEILEEIQDGGFAVINGDNPMLIQHSKCFAGPIYYYGYNSACDFLIRSVERENRGIRIEARLGEVETRLFCPIPSRRLAGNVVAAAATAMLLGVDLDTIRAQLIKYLPGDKRLNILYYPGGGIIINDTYNANPLSMTAALECGREIKAPGRWIAVLGDMFELGQKEQEGHVQVGQEAAQSQLDMLVAVGERAYHIARGAREAGMPADRIHHFSSKPEAQDFLNQILEPRDKILFKASRGMQMETLIQGLTNRDINPGS